MTEKNLRYAIYATSTIFIFEVEGGLYTNNLALLSDAAHMFMDVFALVLTYVAIRIAKRPSSHKVTMVTTGSKYSRHSLMRYWQ